MTHHRRHGNNDTGTYDVEMTTALSPAQRYAAFKQTQAKRQSVSSRFARSMPFELDDFQVKANDALEAGDNVLVAAPTGAGKTVVADFAIYLAQERNVKAFYTTPIKALSNQKYHDLVETYGPDRVGLLTGDTSINSEADIVVMTTEVLRNMLYEHSMTLDALRYVILDEVHYLADRFRGPVWEEVIIHLPQSVRIIGLSATVSNVRTSPNGLNRSVATPRWWCPKNGPCRWNSMCLFRRTTTPNRNSSTCIDVIKTAIRQTSSTPSW